VVTVERPASSRERPLPVADVVRLAGRAVDALGLVWLVGEVTQVSQPSSGHVYFALQDQGSVLPAVMWGRDVARLRAPIQAGQRLRVRGRLGVYDRDGKLQLYADFAEPAGAGAEALALEQLKAKLAAEGIFAAERKRPLPRFPRRIGVVTSAKGAAVHDIIRTVQRRLPTPILIADAAVQGPQAPHQLVMGMAMLVKAGVDVLIVGRGGGAATDLTAFNHERVVRFIKAQVEAIHYLKTRPKEGMEILKRYTRIDAPDVLKPAYDLHIKLFPRVPEIFPEDLKLVLEEVAMTVPKAKGANPASFIDGRAVKDVIASGFVEQLYR